MLTLLAHPDFDRAGDHAVLPELGSSAGLELSRHSPHFYPPGEPHLGRPLEDRFLSRRPVRLEPLPHGGVRFDRCDSGTQLEVDGNEVIRTLGLDAAALRQGVVVELSGRIALLLHRVRPFDPRPPDFGLVGESDAWLELRQGIKHMASLDVPVLLRGEAGTGKKEVARALHDHSQRRRGPFVSVDLATIVPSLAASELFGAQRGDLLQQPGHFANANGGTLFLEQIDEAPAEIQSLLPRVLENREILPVGSSSPQPVDCRIISSTQSRRQESEPPLTRLLADTSLTLPTLRQRRDDIGRLLHHFLRQQCLSQGRSLPDRAALQNPWLPAIVVARLARFDFPGNVDQLAEAARQLVIDGQGRETLQISYQLEINLGLSRRDRPRSSVLDTDSAVDLVLSETGVSGEVLRLAGARSRQGEASQRDASDVGENELLASLQKHRWNLKATADELQIHRTALYSLLQRYPNLRASNDVTNDQIRNAWERHGGDLTEMAADLEISERSLRQRLEDLGLPLTSESK